MSGWPQQLIATIYEALRGITQLSGDFLLRHWEFFVLLLVVGSFLNQISKQLAYISQRMRLRPELAAREAEREAETAYWNKKLAEENAICGPRRKSLWRWGKPVLLLVFLVCVFLKVSWWWTFLIVGFTWMILNSAEEDAEKDDLKRRTRLLNEAENKKRGWANVSEAE
jgi:hypothetical protein